MAIDDVECHAAFVVYSVAVALDAPSVDVDASVHPVHPAQRMEM